jgi:hypothetical protein
MATKLCEYKGLTLGKEEVKPVTAPAEGEIETLDF